MKRVSYNIAKIIKEAGYPQELKEGTVFYCANGLRDKYDSELYELFDPMDCVCPYAIEVWLWLWREKKLYIDVDFCIDTEEIVSYIHYDGIDFVKDDPEEVIIAAIEHLADNNFIK